MMPANPLVVRIVQGGSRRLRHMFIRSGYLGVLTLFLFFLFIGYLALRASVHDPDERARFSAVVGILGMLLVPFIHLSVYLFRTLHPQPVVLKPSAPSLPPEMLRTLLVSMAVFTLLYVGLVTLRYGLGLAEDARDEIADAG